jgi:hypothetical protein
LSSLPQGGLGQKIVDIGIQELLGIGGLEVVDVLRRLRIHGHLAVMERRGPLGVVRVFLWPERVFINKQFSNFDFEYLILKFTSLPAPVKDSKDSKTRDPIDHGTTWD